MNTPPWHISLLGELRAEQNRRSLTRFRTQKTGALLAYLAYYPDRLHPRDVLADMLWPTDDPEAARGSFRTALNSLRKQLEPPDLEPQSVLIADRFHVRLRREACSTDVEQFQAALQEARRCENESEAAVHLARAVQLYRGELLPGFYEEWVLQERRHLEEAYAEALRRLRAYAQATGDLTKALDCAQRLVALDPIAEEAHIEVIRLYRQAGRPDEALRQYDTLARILRDQLDTEPSEESRSLATSLRATAVRPVTIRRTSHRVRSSIPTGRVASPPAPAIPIPMTPFFGREQELDRLMELLTPEAPIDRITSWNPAYKARLFTLLGPGGSGKTRLAIEAARRRQAVFTGAVWFVTLAELSESRSIPDAVLDAMHLFRNSDAPWFTAIQETIGDRAALLVLDNFEHLMEEGLSYVQDLLTHLPGLTCLVTSRIRLDSPGERVFHVSPLPVPGPEERAPEQLNLYAGIKLFLDRAQAARADFQLTPQNAGAVAELCRRLEGLPLALELAASWAQILTPHQMLERTPNSLAVSARRKRAEGDRHESLRAAVEWSYRLLSGEQQRLFRHLSVFRGGWNLAAALAICFPEEVDSSQEEDLLRDLTLLAESSLIQTEEVTLESGPEIRFRMLETLREYGAELLSEDERHRLYARHAAYFLELVEEYAEEFHVKNRDRLDPDLDNLRTALRWHAAAPEGGERTLRMAVAMYWLWQWWEHYAEGIAWLERSLIHGASNSPLLAEAHNVAGNLYYCSSDGEGSLRHQRKHLEIRRHLRDELGIARALGNTGNALGLLGRHVEAIPLHEESYARVCKINATHYIPATLLNLGTRLVDAGEYELGRERLWEGLKACEKIGHQVGVGLCYQSLGRLAQQLDDLPQARTLLEQALKTFREVRASNVKIVEGELQALKALEEQKSEQ